MNIHRPLTVSIATVLLTLLSLFGLITPVVPHKPPTIIIALLLVLGVCGLIAVFGLWKLKRWSLLLTSVISALGILMPGLFLVPPGGKGIVVSVVLALFYVLVLVLVALPATRKAYAAARAPAEQQEAQP